jgi:hypothetical protein
MVVMEVVEMAETAMLLPRPEQQTQAAAAVVGEVMAQARAALAL